MKKVSIAVILLFAALAISCTCAPTNNSLLNDNWGRSFKEAKQNQTFNPDTDKNVGGMDGKAAVKAYNKRFSVSSDSAGAK